MDELGEATGPLYSSQEPKTTEVYTTTSGEGKGTGLPVDRAVFRNEQGQDRHSELDLLHAFQFWQNWRVLGTPLQAVRELGQHLNTERYSVNHTTHQGRHESEG